MKNENKLMKITTFVLLITILALILVSGTYAKYTSSVSGSDSATVAKWSIKVNGTEIAVANPNVTFKLFETINDTNGGVESDVTSGLIAPGTSGAFSVKIKNESEVTAKYSIDFTVSKTNVPIEFSTDNGTTWKSSIDAPAEKTLAVGSAEDTVTVQWRWAFEESVDGNTQVRDTADTNIGIAAQTATTNVTITATINATQVD